MSNCGRCNIETDKLIHIVSRRSDLARGWMTILKNQPACSDDCANVVSRRERVPGYVVGFKWIDSDKITESWI